MADRKTQTPSEDKTRLVLPLDPEEALKALLKVDPSKMPPSEKDSDEDH